MAQLPPEGLEEAGGPSGSEEGATTGKLSFALVRRLHHDQASHGSLLTLSFDP